MNDIGNAIRDGLGTMFSSGASFGDRALAFLGVLFILLIMGVFFSIISKPLSFKNSVFDKKQKELENDPNSLQSYAKERMGAKQKEDGNNGKV